MIFAGKRVLVTAAFRGIGLATARAFLNAGASVAINGRSRDSVAQAIAALGGEQRLAAAAGDIATVAGCALAIDGGASFGR